MSGATLIDRKSLRFLCMPTSRPSAHPPEDRVRTDNNQGPVRPVSRQKRARQLGSRVQLLGAMLLLVTLPLLIASVVLPRRVQATLARLSETALTQGADDLAAFVQKTMALHLERVESIAAQEPLREALLRHNAGTLATPELDRLNRQLLAVVRDADTEVQGIFVVGRDGFTFAGVLQSGAAEPYRHVDVNDRDYFGEVARTRRPLVSNPFRSKISGLPVIAVCAPILEPEGGFAGFVAITIKIQHLSDQFASRRIGETGYPFAVDNTGLLVAHPDRTRLFSDSLIRGADAERMVTRMLAGERGIEAYVSSHGERKIAAFAPVPICRWSVAASMFVTEYEAPAHELRLIIYGMIGACVIVASIAGMGFAVGLERQKLALDEARASEARFRLFSSVAGTAIWDWDFETDEFWWNGHLRDAFGWERQEVATHAAFRDRVPLNERDAICTDMRNGLREGLWSGEHSFLRADGTVAYVLHRASVVRDTKGRAIRAIGGMTDISGRRATEQKIAEQAALLNQTRDGIVVFDLDGTVQFWNSGAENLYGWKCEEAQGRRIDELLRIEAADFADACRSALKQGQWFGRLRKTTRGNAVLTIDGRFTLMRDEQGDPKAILSIATDITERLQMEAKFLRTQRLESIGTLAGGIAHDLNNLLSPIIMGVGVLKLTERDADDARIIQYIEQSANRGAQLVKQVLSFARGVEGARVSVHAGYVIREVEEIARSTFPKNITFRTELAKNLRLVRADPTQLNQVLLNLCVNARDAMPAGGHLTISARNLDLDAAAAAHLHDAAPGPYILIEVADTGTGMAPALIDKIFEPFFTTKAAGKGTGLGLSTVLGIVRSHGGTVSVYSEIGKGSVFRIYLPEISGVEAADAAAPVAALPGAPIGAGEVVLLVDDAPTILSVAKEVLERQGFSVLLATDGAHAFTLYHRHRDSIALVITDMMMPLMDGAALIVALRRIDPEIAVIGSSGLNDNHNQIKAAETGLEHFLLKPYTAATLLETVRAVLAARAERSKGQGGTAGGA